MRITRRAFLAAAAAAIATVAAPAVEAWDPRFCPACGAGVVEWDGSRVTCRLPQGYPFNGPCETCERRLAERMRAIGRELARRREEAAWKAILG